MTTTEEKTFGCDDLAANRQLYRAEIRALAETYAALAAMQDDAPDDWDECKEILRLCNEAGYPEGFGPSAWLHETLDSHEWVIYTYKAQLVALCSDIDGREEAQDLEMSNPTAEQVAYLCMEADIRAEAQP